MTTYLLDTSVFLQARKTYFSFEFCPGFWDWIQQMHKAGSMYSIQEVKQELSRQDDDVKCWSDRINQDFFLPSDKSIESVVTQLKQDLIRNGYQEKAIKNFMRGADPALIAYGKKYNYTVVTQERSSKRKKIKIPVACIEAGVKCEMVHTVLRNEHPALILEGQNKTLGAEMRLKALESEFLKGS